MSLLRFLARSMLASHFVIDGVNALIHPQEHLDAARPVVETVLPKVEALLPAQAARFLPGDAAGLVRASAVAQILGGLSLASGVGRRVGATVLAVCLAPKVLTAKPWQKEADLTGLGTDVALLGGVLLAAQDTEGRPNLARQVRAHQQLAAKDAELRKAQLQRSVQAATSTISRRGCRSVRRAQRSIEGALS